MTAAFIRNLKVATRSSSISVDSLASLSSPFEQFTSSTSLTLADATQSVTTLPSGETFEPILPDSSTLIAFGSIILLSALAVWVWANQVVPVSRTNLALSKKNGPVKDYLDELRAAEAMSNVQEPREPNVAATSETEFDLQEKEMSSPPTREDAQTTIGNSRSFERWLFTDWLQKESPKGRKSKGRQKEPALPVLKNAKWNSGDNPVLVASALIMGGVLLSAVAEKVGSDIF